MYSFLFETTNVVPYEKLDILEEGKTSDGHPRLAFNARLQEANIINANKRRYSTQICESIVSSLQPKAKTKSMYLEVDHPLFFEGNNDPEMMKKRAALVELKNCGAICRNIKFENGFINGEIQTLSG